MEKLVLVEDACKALKDVFKGATDLDIQAFKANLALAPGTEIVRCKDCKYQNKGGVGWEAYNLCDYRPWLYIKTEDDNFCKYAERRN